MALGLNPELFVDLCDLVGDTGWGRVDSGSIGQEVVQSRDSLGSGKRAGLEDLELQRWWWDTSSVRHGDRCRGRKSGESKSKCQQEAIQNKWICDSHAQPPWIGPESPRSRSLLSLPPPLHRSPPPSPPCHSWLHQQEFSGMLL